MSGIAAAVAGAATSAVGTTGNTILNYGLNRSATKYSTEKQKELAQYESFLNRQDYQWQKKLDYAYDANQYYDLSRRYSENSAKWSVTGLRNAGLNPILAATDGNFASTYGSGASSGSMGHASTSSPSGFSGSSGDMGVSAGIRAGLEAYKSDSEVANTTASTDNTRVDTQTKKALRTPLVASAHADAYNKTLQGSILQAEREKIDAERDQITANTAKTLGDLTDIQQGRNVSGMWNVIGRLVNGLYDGTVGHIHSADDALKSKAENLGLKSFFRHSAKDEIEGIKREDRSDEEFEKFLREQQERFEHVQSLKKHSYIHTR